MVGVTAAVVDADRRFPRPKPREFCFREAGVERFNDVYDDGYDED